MRLTTPRPRCCSPTAACTPRSVFARTSAERQTRNVLLRILREREPDLDEHLRSVASLAVLLARHAGV